MIKKLLIGASALAMTTTVAHAQLVSQATPDAAVEVNISKNTTVPVTSNSTFGNNIGNRDATTPVNKATAVINAVTGAGLPALTDAGNKAAVDQDGDSNNGVIDQQGGQRGWAAIKQNGDSNSADIDQDETVGGNASIASRNAAFVQQIGNGQKAEVNQVKDSNVGGRNNASIQQGGFSTTFANPAFPFGPANITVTPNGLNNQARVDQTGSGNDANIAQGVGAVIVGGLNYAYVEQVRLTAGGVNSNNSATIQQRFDGNAAIFQRGATNSTAVIVQGLGLLSAGGLDSDVVQTGNNNYAANYQDVTFGSADSFIKQNGNSNKAFVNQSGDLTNGVSTVFQNGNFNDALVLQTAAPVSTATVSQLGNSNVATVKQ
ncbi:hypothetical protein [Novosphingobium sp. JCM 18896]|uniref:hypothetical protein n=1 Tax=Novosphingobium sp. JCM 18896 TaxID=2989731 RepID=UPI0022222399|nr:hypothetical protein [Novosphingobium sp. JCM 18896]MCW1431501.1 hypothetical protein [Novosphingobium sp. JCM 18896]